MNRKNKINKTEDTIVVPIYKKDLKEILDFFLLYFQKVFLYIEKKKLIFFNIENETQISLMITLKCDYVNKLKIFQGASYVLDIRKVLVLITNTDSDDEWINMIFGKNGYGFTEETELYNYTYFKKKEPEQLLNFHKDSKKISSFLLTNQFNIFGIYLKTEEFINFKINKDSISFFFNNEHELYNIDYPLINSIDLINDVGENLYSINILFLKIISKINKHNKYNNPIISNILCDDNQHYISSLNTTFENNNYSISILCKIQS